MSTIAEFSIPSESFAVGRAFSEIPGVEVELERLVPTGETVVPYFWVRSPDVDTDALLSSLYDHHAVTTATLVDSVDGQGTLFRVEWNRNFRDAVTAITESELTLLFGHGTPTEWRFEFRADDHAALTVFGDVCDEHGVEYRLVRAYEVSSERAGPYGLTATQERSMLLAFERGYFDESRRVTLEELAEQVGVSRQSFAMRLRRGHRNLIANTLEQSGDRPVG